MTIKEEYYYETIKSLTDSVRLFAKVQQWGKYQTDKDVFLEYCWGQRQIK